MYVILVTDHFERWYKTVLLYRCLLLHCFVLIINITNHPDYIN